uniref:Uncharacterized protein n=1 Tax=Ralstonia solanacearum TaxID=305 RepID=A0A0S4U525_RALSL|nr:protein of unknown function [Ralstonia solanacearum]
MPATRKPEKWPGSRCQMRWVRTTNIHAEMGTLFDFRCGGKGLVTLYRKPIPFRITRESIEINQLLCKNARFSPSARCRCALRAANLLLPCSGMTSATFSRWRGKAACRPRRAGWAWSTPPWPAAPTRSSRRSACGCSTVCRAAGA